MAVCQMERDATQPNESDITIPDAPRRPELRAAAWDVERFPRPSRSRFSSPAATRESKGGDH